MTKAVRASRATAVFVLGAACALVSSFVAPTYAAANAATNPPTRPTATAVANAVANPKGKFLGVIPSLHSPGVNARAMGGTAHAAAITPVTYHNGPVQHASTVYAILWKPAAVALPAGYQAVVSQYFADVAKASFGPSNVYGAGTQYYDITAAVKQPEFYSVAVKPVIADTRAYPANGCPNYQLDDGTTSTHCLTDAQIVNEIKTIVAARALPTGLATNYFVFTPPGVATCFDATALSTGGCYDPMAFTGFCAYHSHLVAAGKNVLYATLPYAAIAGCDSGQSPENNSADSVLNAVAHEHLESMTDPLGTAWYDSAGNEIADKCYANFGTAIGTNAFGQYNQVINTHDYWLQRMWSNRAQACVQRNTFVQPVASFTFTPAAPVHGQQVSFTSTSHNPDGTALKYRWVFPGGTASPLPNPKFTFATAGTVTVNLIVWDAQGDQARVQRTFAVH